MDRHSPVASPATMPERSVTADTNARQSRQGVLYGIIAYGSWGLIPLYFKWVGNVPPGEVLAHRVIWSFILLAGLVTALGRWQEVRRALAVRLVVLALSASTLLLAANWFTYIYAVSTNQVVEASLGYFLNPLVNVVLGVVILKEHLRRGQLASIVLAGIGVLILGAPLIAVTLAISFAFYGLVRKTVAVNGLVGLFVETLLLLPLAVAYAAYLAGTDQATFGIDNPGTSAKLMISSVVTAGPLLAFTAAARRLRFATLGFLQYLAPSVQFFLAVVIFDEPLARDKVVALCCIWVAVAIYSYDSLRHLQSQRNQLAPPTPADV